MNDFILKIIIGLCILMVLFIPYTVFQVLEYQNDCIKKGGVPFRSLCLPKNSVIK